MNFDIQYLFNTIGSGLVGAYLYLFKRVGDLEKRVQSLEDIHTIKIDQVAQKVDKLESKIEELAHNIHKEKNIEGQLSQAIFLLIKKLDEKGI
jgi:hypothetical protein